MYCQNCGAEIDDNAYVCIHCGVRTDCRIKRNVGAQPVHCQNCGAEIDPNAYICVHCGVRTGIQSASEEKKNKGLTKFCAVLSIIMSVIGVTFLGALLGILGMAISIERGDQNGKKLNLTAIICCVGLSVAAIIIGLL